MPKILIIINTIYHEKSIVTLVVLMAFTIAGFSQSLNKNTLCKKWYLEKYVVFYIKYSPDEKEKNDYILLRTDMTYICVDEGERSVGKWNYNDDENFFFLYDKSGEGLKFIVTTLKTNKMVLKVDIEEMKGVNIHFTTTKK